MKFVKGYFTFICLFACLFYFAFILQSYSAILLFLGGGVLLTCKKWEKGNAWLYYSLCMLFVIVFHEYNIWKYGNYYYQGVFSDDYVYEQDSLSFYNEYGLNFFYIYHSIGVAHNSAGYVYVLALLRWFGTIGDGYNPFLPKILNVFVLQWISYFVYRIAVDLCHLPMSKVNRYLFIIALYPSLLNIASYVFRDTLVSLFLVWVYYLLNRKKRSWRDLLGALGLCFMLFFFRAFAAYILLILILFFLFRIQNIKQALLIGGGIAVFAFGLFHDILLQMMKAMIKYNGMNVERLGGIGAKIFSLPLYLGAMPRLVFMILNPIPTWTNIQSFFAGTSCFFQAVALPFVWQALVSKYTVLQLKVTFIVLFLGVAFSTASFRHITMYLPFGFLLFLCGINEIAFGSLRYGKILFGSFVFYLISMLLVLFA